MSEQVVYIGRDLEAMFFARNYHRWIADAFRPFVGKRLVEVGAGTGAFSELLLESAPESLSLVEPSSEQHRILDEHIHSLASATRIETYNATFREVAERIKAAQAPDSIFYVNVLEHIRDDDAELRAVRETLPTGGRIFVFVPAMPWLYGNFDREVGHFRRYRKAELEEKCSAAGFRVLKSVYFDLFGVAPWWIQYRLLRASTLKPGAVKLYDRLVVPLTKAFETLVKPPLGKNILLVAEKS
jgi:2-polyprenyl-3-methyl-5-hydroxy-6-metoxy-1,4-benzoquinol methylase